MLPFVQCAWTVEKGIVMAVKKKAVAKKKATHRMPNGMMMEGAFHGAKKFGPAKKKK